MCVMGAGRTRSQAIKHRERRVDKYKAVYIVADRIAWHQYRLTEEAHGGEHTQRLHYGGGSEPEKPRSFGVGNKMAQKGFEAR